MGLAAMVHLVLEKMQQKHVGALCHLRVVGAFGAHPPRQYVGRQGGAEPGQPEIGPGLQPAQFRHRGNRRAVIDRSAQPALFQRIDVIEVDGVDVIHRGGEGGEEAGPPRGEICLR